MPLQLNANLTSADASSSMTVTQKCNVLDCAIAVSLLLLVAQPPPPVNAAQLEGETLLRTLYPGETFEACREAAKNDRLNFSFSSSRPISFDVHYHVGTDMIVPVKKQDTRDFVFSLIIPMTAGYCLWWQNTKEEYVEIKYQLEIK